MTCVVRYDWKGGAFCNSINEWLYNHGMHDVKIQVSSFLSPSDDTIYEADYLMRDGNNFANWSRVAYDLKYGMPEDLWHKFSADVERVANIDHNYHFIYHDKGTGWKRWVIYAITSDQSDEDLAIMLIEFDEEDQAIEFKLTVDAPK